METVYLKKIGEVKKMKLQLEKKLKVKIKITRGRVDFEGSSLDEFDALQVFEAVAFGFGVRKALRLLEEDIIFRRIHIKEYTKRNLKDVKARLIGTHGKTRKTISLITDCDVLIGESEVGILGFVEDVENASIAIINVIKGAKQANAYAYLERMNRVKKKEGQPDL
jgi:KH domain-containing protein